MNRPRLLLASSLATAGLLTITLALAARADAKKQPVAPPPSAPPAQVALVAVRDTTAAPREEVTGQLKPSRALAVGFDVGGRLHRILVRKGAKVAEGQVIAQLDPELADAQVAQAEAALKAAQAQAEVAADTARRQGDLADRGSVSEWQGRSSRGQSEAAQANVLAAKAALAQARILRKRHDLRAPFAAVLVEAPDQVGAYVGAGKELFTLEQLDPLTLKVTVPDTARALIRPGAKVPVVAVSNGASTDEAQVRVVIPSADASTRRVPVEISVPNADGRFTGNTLARVKLPLGEPSSALALPASALSSVGGDHVYAVGPEGAVRRVAVTVLERGAREVVVKSGERLEKVVDYPAVDLAEGARVLVK